MLKDQICRGIDKRNVNKQALTLNNLSHKIEEKNNIYYCHHHDHYHHYNLVACKAFVNHETKAFNSNFRKTCFNVTSHFSYYLNSCHIKSFPPHKASAFTNCLYEVIRNVSQTWSFGLNQINMENFTVTWIYAKFVKQSDFSSTSYNMMHESFHTSNFIKVHKTKFHFKNTSSCDYIKLWPWLWDENHQSTSYTTFECLFFSYLLKIS